MQQHLSRPFWLESDHGKSRAKREDLQSSVSPHERTLFSWTNTSGKCIELVGDFQISIDKFRPPD
jgi:hypothetical protein